MWRGSGKMRPCPTTPHTHSWSVAMTAENVAPAQTAVTATCSASTRVGTKRLRRLRCPRPSWPWLFAPHAKTAPPCVAAIECESPHEMRVTGLPSSAVTSRGVRSCAGEGGTGGKKGGSHSAMPSPSADDDASLGFPWPSWPRRPSPHVHTSQLQVSTATCARPAATATMCRRNGLSARSSSIPWMHTNAQSTGPEPGPAPFTPAASFFSSSSTPLPPPPSNETSKSPLKVRRKVLGHGAAAPPPPPLSSCCIAAIESTATPEGMPVPARPPVLMARHCERTSPRDEWLSRAAAEPEPDQSRPTSGVERTKSRRAADEELPRRRAPRDVIHSCESAVAEATAAASAASCVPR